MSRLAHFRIFAGILLSSVSLHYQEISTSLSTLRSTGSFSASPSTLSITLSTPRAAELVSGHLTQWMSEVGSQQQLAVTAFTTKNANAASQINSMINENGTHPSVNSNSPYTASMLLPSYVEASDSAYTGVSLTSTRPSHTERYVASNGSDRNDGSARHPWATVQHAASLAQPGWTVHVGPGTYSVGSGIVNNNSGNSSARIVYIGSYDKATWTWNTKLVSNGTAVWTTDSNYVDIVGLDLTSTNTAATWGFHLGGSYLRIMDNYVHDIYSDSPGAGIMIGGGGTTTGVEVTGNVVAREAHTAGGNTDNQCIYTTESHTTIVNNIVFGCSKYGIQVYSSIAGGSNYNVIANNTVFASYRGIVVGGEDVGNGPPTVDYNTMINNIIYGMKSYGFNASGIFGSHNVTSNNLTYNNGANYSPTYTNHTNDIVSDPLFVNYKSDGTGNYQLKPTSPCRDAGARLGAPRSDFRHFTRPYGRAVDCGAYEFEQ